MPTRQLVRTAPAQYVRSVLLKGPNPDLLGHVRLAPEEVHVMRVFLLHDGRMDIRGGKMLTVLLLPVALFLGACTSTSVDAVAPTSSPAPGMSAGSPEMSALCDEMVAAGMTPDEATALAEGRGYSARVGIIDGEPQALTMDFRVDRFTFDVESGAVTGCTYG